ncbi:hypothetical protein [Pseudomonas sp. Pseu.R1]|uniref:hypothetical protein n=1 Tax=Pseudomonas sp. Pseu.R1 TaxID=3379818 RepID=UPI003B94F43F
MSLIVEVLQGFAAVGALAFGYVKLSAAEKISAHSLLKRAAILSAMGIIAATSVWHVMTFAFGDGLPSRREILWLLLNLWNATIYTILGIGLFAYLLKQPLQPSDDGVGDVTTDTDNSGPK